MYICDETHLQENRVVLTLRALIKLLLIQSHQETAKCGQSVVKALIDTDCGTVPRSVSFTFVKLELT